MANNLMVNEDKMSKNNAEEWGSALFNYAVYGANSPYLSNLSLKELKAIKGYQLLNVFTQSLQYDGYIKTLLLIRAIPLDLSIRVQTISSSDTVGRLPLRTPNACVLLPLRNSR